MLNIPESVKALYKTDGVHKNFRAHFPNGEMVDITNANIVRESLHFTESLCSQSNFRFGLAEASVLEFETVGVANMYGMTINASIEIDVSSLTAAQIADIQAGTWDGELVDLSASDLGFVFYRIPLGVFRIEKCPRNHGAMTHRRVAAYGELAAYNPFFDQKLFTYVPEKILSSNAYYETLSLLGYRNKAGVLSLGFEETAVTEWQPVNGSKTRSIIHDITLKDSQGNSVLFSGFIEFRYAAYPETGQHLTTRYTVSDLLYAVDVHGVDYSTTLQEVAAALSELDIDLAASGYSSWDDLAADMFAKDDDGVPLITPGVIYEARRDGKGGQDSTPKGTLCPITSNNDAVYPFVGDAQTSDGRAVTGCRFFLPWKLTILYGYAELAYDKTITPATVTVLLPDSAPPSLPLSIPASATVKLDPGTFSYKAYQHSGDIDGAGIADGYLEVGAYFARLRRTGLLNLVRLSNAAPAAILPGDYEDVWWDEYDVSPIGSVIVTYKAQNKDTTTSISIGSGASEYDMTGNEMLKNMGGLSYYAIHAILASNFRSNAKKVGFTPIEMSMKSWPWLEAGDALRITAEDGTLVNTYALRVEMDGVQHLMSTITAEGGEIVGET